MPIGATVGSAAIGAAGSIGGALIGSSAATAASSQLKKASKKAVKDISGSLETSNTYLKPQLETGQQGLYSIADLFGFKNPNNPDGSTPFGADDWAKFQATPYYQNILKAGINGLDQSAAARGNLLSSGHMNRVAQLAEQHASTQFGTYMDRLMSLANMGGNAATSMSNNTLNAGTNMANMRMQGAGAAAAGTIAAGNQWSNALGNIGQNGMDMAFMLQKPNAGYTSISPYQ